MLVIRQFVDAMLARVTALKIMEADARTAILNVISSLADGTHPTALRYLLAMVAGDAKH